MLINKNWSMKQNGFDEPLSCRSFPVSMYQTLISNGKTDDPYYGENENAALELSREDCTFYCEFEPEALIFSEEKVFLRFFGIDTLSEIYLNGFLLGTTDNMFVTYEYEVKDKLIRGTNLLSVHIKSPLEYIEKCQKERPVWGVESTVPGYPHLRKAHYMFGWDWGPKLPDMGIWRDVELVGKSVAEIENVYITQQFSDNYKKLTLTVKPDLRLFSVRPLSLLIQITLSDGRELFSKRGLSPDNDAVFTVNDPPLWYPRGYGDQPLQSITLTLYDGDKIIDVHSEKIGFRTLTIHKDDENGIFCFNCNGTDIFAMGANYVPGDNILPYLSEQRIKAFLDECLFANFNTLRVWGGGMYADDFLLSECDRLGIIVWQDFMFACAVYRLTPKLEASINAEIKCNVLRMRNHACIGLWCGNNEIESMWEYWGVPSDPEAQNDYIRLFEHMIPDALRKLDPERFYWPSSPSSGGNILSREGCFHDSSSNFKGDQHYWDVWHNLKPLEEFRKFKFPFCSEYGFESVPSIKTVRAFAKESDLNLCSPVIECHQKCTFGNEKLLYYIAQMCRFPDSFEKLIYASQLVQSEAIKSDVEHMRRNRGHCMGSLYWQVNDSNPVISWSSIDYFGRRKALHYAASHFYAPVLLSCAEDSESKVTFNISNEKTAAAEGILRWSLRTNEGSVIKCGDADFSVPPLSASDILELNFSGELTSYEKKRTVYLEYSAEISGSVISRGTTIFTRPKAFDFINPKISVDADETPSEYILTVSAAAFTKGVFLDLKNADCVFSDNWFDLNAGEPYTVSVRKDSLSKSLIKSDFLRSLTVMSCYDLL